VTELPQDDEATTPVAVASVAALPGPMVAAEPHHRPRWRAFLRQYRRPMQLVPLVAGALLLVIPGQAPTSALLVGLSVLNAAMGVRREGWAAATEASLEISSLHDELDRLTSRILAVAGIALVLSIAIGLAWGLGAEALLLVAVALAVAALPNGLPLAMAASRSRGMGTEHVPLRPIRFGLACLFGFIATFLGSSVVGIFAGIPFAPLGTLWINFTVGVFGMVGLGRGELRESLEGSPRRPSRILPGTLAAWLVVCGFVMAVGTVGIAVYAKNTWDEPAARTMALVTFSLFHLWLALETADPRRSMVSPGILRNPTLLRATIASLVAIALAVTLAPLAQLLRTTGLALDQWLLCLAVSLTIVVVAEAKKRLRLDAGGEVEAAGTFAVVPT